MCSPRFSRDGLCNRSGLDLRSPRRECCTSSHVIVAIGGVWESSPNRSPAWRNWHRWGQVANFPNPAGIFHHAGKLVRGQPEISPAGPGHAPQIWNGIGGGWPALAVTDVLAPRSPTAAIGGHFLCGASRESTRRSYLKRNVVAMQVCQMFARTSLRSAAIAFTQNRVRFDFRDSPSRLD